MSGKLTARACDGARPPDGTTQIDLADGENGLILRAGRRERTWFVRYRTRDGARRKLRLGAYPGLSLADARAKARAIAAAVDQGADPAAIPQKTPQTLQHLADEYWPAAAAGRHKTKGRPKRVSTLRHEQALWRLHIAPALGARPFSEVTPADIRALLNGLHDDGLSAATCNGVGAVLRQVFNFAVREERLDRAPRAEWTPFATVARERVLSREELRQFWRAVHAATEPIRASEALPPFPVPGRIEAGPTPAVALALMLTTATLARVGDVAAAEWREIDRNERVWVIPAKRFKGRRSHAVPLSPLALEVLDAAQRLPGGGARFVFPGGGMDSDRPLTRHGLSRAYARLTGRLAIADTSAHDLRRTGATMLTGEACGVSRFVVSKLLGHASDGGGAAAVTGVYDRNEYLADKRRAAEAWAGVLESLYSTNGCAE